jgi:hypothetical protein
VSKSNDVSTSALDLPGSGSAGKALRPVSAPDGGEAAVFRLDSLAPGAAGDGVAGPGGLEAPRGSKVSHAAIFFAVLIVVGGGLLFVMRRIGINPMSAIASMKEPEVDLTKNAKPPVDHRRVLRDLSESAVKSQVPIEQVQKNPFEIPEVIAAEKIDDPAEIERRRLEREAKNQELRRQRIETELASMQLHGIIGGSNPVARINDKAVRIGDRFGDYFTVANIQGRIVELDCDGEVYVLSLDANDKAPTRKSGKKRK